jgi:hypothetical protein
MSARVKWVCVLGALVSIVTLVAVAGCSVASHTAVVTSKPTASTSASADASESESEDDGSSEDTAAANSQKAGAALAASQTVDEVAGVRLGADDGSVKKRLGRGLFTNQEDHGGGRYYVDAARTVTLHVQIGTDSAIDSIEFTSGIYLPAGLAVQDDLNVASSALTSSAITSKGIALGMSVAELKLRLGKPTRDDRTGVQRIIVYDDESGDSNYWAQFTFVGDHLRDMWISDGD